MNLRRHSARIIEAVAWLAILAAVAMTALCVVGCATIPITARGVEDVQQGVVNAVAKIERAEARIIGVQKEVQQSINQRVQATRDAVVRTNEGVGEWAMVFIVALFMIGDVGETWIRARAGERRRG